MGHGARLCKGLLTQSVLVSGQMRPRPEIPPLHRSSCTLPDGEMISSQLNICPDPRPTTSAGDCAEDFSYTAIRA